MQINVVSESRSNSIRNGIHVLPNGKFSACLATDGSLTIHAADLGNAVSFEASGDMYIADREEHTGYAKLRPTEDSGTGTLTIRCQSGDVVGLITIGGTQVADGAKPVH